MGIGIITVLSNLFSGHNFSTITDKQELALVDALAFAMAADREVSQVEQDALVKALRVLDWEQESSLESYVQKALSLSQQEIAKSGDAVAYCTDISQRLGEDWLREEVYYLAGRIAASDTEINPNEREFLSTMIEAFQLDTKAQARIADQLLRETKF